MGKVLVLSCLICKMGLIVLDTLTGTAPHYIRYKVPHNSPMLPRR